MRHFTAYEVYDYFLKDDYKTKDNMIATFHAQKYNDKQNKYKNKEYLVAKGKYYLESDVKEFLNFRIEQYNTITYAKQLIIDLTAIFDYLELNLKNKLAKILGINSSTISSLDLGYETALRIIEALKNRLLEISPEAREDLKMMFNKVKED